MLRMNGVSFNLYFASFFCNLTVLYFIMYAGLLITVVAFDVASLTLAPAFGTMALLYLLYMPSALIYSGAMSYLFDKSETARQFYPNMATTIGFITYTCVSLIDLLVVDSNAGTILHIVFTVTLPYYIPFGILYYINKVYLTCTLQNTCDSLVFADYMNLEISIMLLMCIVNTPIYFMVLRVVDARKSGGDLREALFLKVSSKIG